MQEMSNKIDRLGHLLEETKPDIIVLSEHGLKTQQLENTRLEKYRLKTHFCRENHKKGGVAIYVKEELEATTQDIPIKTNRELTIEMGMVKIMSRKKQLYILGVYRTPGGNLEEALNLLSETLEETKAENYPILVLGDINVDSMKNDRNSQMLNNTLSSHDITRLPLPPTRITPTSSTSIDFICTNLNQDLVKTTIINSGISDHTTQLCEVKFIQNKPNQNIKTCRKLNQESLNLLKVELEKEDWIEVHTADSPETAYKHFLSTITMTMNSICPQKNVPVRRRKNQPTYSNKETKHLKDKYLQCLRRYELTGEDADKAEMTKAKKDYDIKLKHLRRKLTADHVARAANKSKALWQVINSERKNQKQELAQPQINIEGQITDDPYKIANYFNSYFTSIAENTLKSQPRPSKRTAPHLPTSNYDLTQLPLTNEQEIEAIIKSMKPKTSSGLDDISAKLLKHCSKALILPLVSITNLSLSQGHFPSDLKQSKVYPKLKGGTHTEVGNYRPISLIPTCSKVIERVVLKRLMDHCQLHNILTKNQHGFIKGRSTTSAMTKLTEFIIDALEEGNMVAGIMLDLSKAFDCLAHKLILNKLEHLGIKGQAKAWLRSYLEGRSQIVEIQYTQNGKTQATRSKSLPISRGVPQGSVLGPVLFILLTNDMPQYLGTHCSPLMYADDATLLISDSSPNNLIVNAYIALHMAYQYCNENDLVVNTDKTKQLAFGRRNVEIPALPDVKLETHTKFLGMTVDNNLQWNDHIESLSKKLNSSLYVLKRIKHISNEATTKVAYHALFESHMRYGLLVWGGTTTGNLNRILLLQKRAIRIMSELGPRESCRNFFPRQKILTIVGLYIREVIMHVDKEHLKRGLNIHRHNTRYALNFHLPLHHTSHFQKKPSYMGQKLFNLLPCDMKTLQGQKLKTTLTRWLTNRPFYSIDEFLDWRRRETSTT